MSCRPTVQWFISADCRGEQVHSMTQWHYCLVWLQLLFNYKISTFSSTPCQNILRNSRRFHHFFTDIIALLIAVRTTWRVKHFNITNLKRQTNKLFHESCWLPFGLAQPLHSSLRANMKLDIINQLESINSYGGTLRVWYIPTSFDSPH